MQRIIIFANGELPDLNKARLLLRAGDRILCADGGTRHALALGVRPDLIIGDLDSADEGVVQKFRNDGVKIESHPRDKNETDLELAIHTAIELSPKQIVIIAALGGRLDQTLANITLLSDPRLLTFDARLDDGVEEVLLCREPGGGPRRNRRSCLLDPLAGGGVWRPDKRIEVGAPPRDAVCG